MDVKWTIDQQKVIDARDCNILVSAAAGSGKTAVLVERIVKRITDENNPVDIDKLLIVTFTNAAASEMRDRITKALEEKRIVEPENELLERQLTLVHNAQIATIDSFCLFVVRNHFEEINLDPNFRIADSGELELLCDDVLDRVFEGLYEEKNPAFLRLVDCYSGKGSDEAIRKMVKSIYDAASSASWPLEWMEGLKDIYKPASYDAFMNNAAMCGIVSGARTRLEDAKGLLSQALDISKNTVGLEKVTLFLEDELKGFDKVSEIETFEELKHVSMGMEFKRFPIVKDVVNKDKVKNLRDMAKAMVVDQIVKKYASINMEEVYQQVLRLSPFVDTLVDASITFSRELDREKRSKKIVDFADIEHFALQILVDQNSKLPTATAKEFRKHFDEIMIDEYQDSNQVQEDILVSISQMEEGRYNMFMVGDVKQSIYRFRMAKPELFIEKYNSYSTEEKSKKLLIDLHQNFRSRSEVIDFTNDMFYKLMHGDLGGVNYDSKAALHLGANFKESNSMSAEMLLYDCKDDDESEQIEASNQQIEASIIAKRIRELMQNGQVTDKDTGEIRPVKYSDIVILLRGLSGLGEIIHKTLLEDGIPTHIQSKSGYFSAYEIQVLMDLLTILDNPYQDIPMASVLRSPIVGLTDEKLADFVEDGFSFSEKVLQAMQDENSEIYEFGKLYEKLREACVDTSIYKLLLMILEETDFLNYVSCMPAGNKRKANVMMLLEKAIAYEKTSYKGLFHFVKYIQKIKKYDLEGEADVIGEGMDTVRIMTIHKSKGLEFPIVFVSGIHKKFNEMEIRTPLVIHDALGLGIDEQLDEPHIKRKSLLKEEIANRIKLENKGEELRVLYVALTRAKEKLILTGVVNNRTTLESNAVGNVLPYEPISFSQRCEATSYLSWLYPAILSYAASERPYEITWIGASDVILVEAEKLAKQDLEYEELMKKINEHTCEKKIEFDKAFSYEYPFMMEALKKTKYSVSELKHKAMVMNYDREEDGVEIPQFVSDEKESYIPSFVSGEEDCFDEVKVNPGALRGTAVHRVMECLDFKALLQMKDSKSFVEAELCRMQKEGKITNEMFELISMDKICRFVESDMAKRMARADEEGFLFREKPFVMQHEEGFLVQGIIDVFWMEKDNIVLLDYKTDGVSSADELIKRYKTQLDLYADALQRVFTTNERKVIAQEKLIYSFALEEVINL